MVVTLSFKNNRSRRHGFSERPRTDMATFEEALHMAGYGWVSLSVLCACASAFLATGVQNALMSFVLPAARCDLHLTTYRAGLVNMAFTCGGVVSAFFWGIVGDVFGRKKMLYHTLVLDSVVTLAQSFVEDYRMLVAARAVNGFLIGCPSTLVFTYLSDMVGLQKRQRYLNITGMCFIAAWLILPAAAWLVIPFKLDNYASTIYPVHSWRLYLALSSLPGIISAVCLKFLPESPRLLANTDRNDEAVDILRGLHKWNKRSKEDYEIKSIIPDIIFIAKLTKGNRTKKLFLNAMGDLRSFVSKKYAWKSSLILFVFFANMSAGFGLNLWIPELLLRTQNSGCAPTNVTLMATALIPQTRNESTILYEENDSKLYSPIYDRHADLINILVRNHTENEYESQKDLCNDEIDTEVFINSIEVGVLCVLSNLACSFLCSRHGPQGVRSAAAFCAVVCAGACVSLAVTACVCSGYGEITVIAAAILTASSLNGNVLLIRLLLVSLPSKLSGLGVCWGAWWGRSGGVVVNMAVGALLDFSCPVPFIGVAVILAISSIAIFCIKLEKTPELEPNGVLETNQPNSPQRLARATIYQIPNSI